MKVLFHESFEHGFLVDPESSWPIPVGCICYIKETDRWYSFGENLSWFLLPEEFVTNELKLKLILLI